MSYCRWSSDNFRCDVYVYEAEYGGFVIHVAKGRHTADTPVPEIPSNWHEIDPQDFLKAHMAQMAWLDKAVVIPIGLPHDGESFNFDTAADCATKLEELKALGYQVPQYAIDNLKEEANEN